MSLKKNLHLRGASGQNEDEMTQLVGTNPLYMGAKRPLYQSTGNTYEWGWFSCKETLMPFRWRVKHEI